jgi:hypothetical protein
LDANVLYPTVMREVLMAVAKAGLFQPLWSARILEEWARAAEKLGPGGAALARGDIALLRAAWPEAEQALPAGLEAQLWLPDPADVHVLAAAVAGAAQVLVTENARDFPQAELAPHGLQRQGADAFLMGLYAEAPEAVAAAAWGVQAEAERLSGAAQPIRKLLKKARLPRLGKALDHAAFSG